MAVSSAIPEQSTQQWLTGMITGVRLSMSNAQKPWYFVTISALARLLAKTLTKTWKNGAYAEDILAKGFEEDSPREEGQAASSQCKEMGFERYGVVNFFLETKIQR